MSSPALRRSETIAYQRRARLGGRTEPLLLASSVLLFVILALSVSAFAEENSENPAPPSATTPPAQAAPASSAVEEEPIEEFGLWPLLTIEETPSQRQLALRPLYWESEAKDGSEKKVQVLWPLYLYRRYEQDVTIRILPLFTYWKDVYAFDEGLEYDTHYMLFPLVFGGSSTESGSYFALFPIAGQLKNFLGRDEIHFFLFPLYLDYSKGELKQRSYLWPVVSFSSGDDYNGFRIWPLFGHFEKKNDFRNEFILWPIYHHQTFDLDKEQSGERLLILPFYAREDGRRRSYRAYLWPFFSHEENYAGNFEAYTAPWPFIVMSRGEVYRTQFWPLYGYKKAENVSNRFWFWPFWHQRVATTGEDSIVYETHLLPVISSREEVSESEGLVRRNFQFWPLWRSHKSKDGSTSMQMLSLLWFHSEEFEQHYAPLWTIYEHGTKADGTSQTSALWRLYRHTHGATGSETRIPLLFSSTEDTGQDTARTKILGGLLGSSRNGAERRLQVLFFIHSPY